MAEITDETMSLRARSICAGVRAKSLQLCPTRDHSPPDSWDSSGKNTRVGCHFLLQGIFPTQESNPCLLCLLRWQVGSLLLLPHGRPVPGVAKFKQLQAYQNVEQEAWCRKGTRAFAELAVM